MEPESNIGSFCSDECAEKAGLRKKYPNIPMEILKGKYVKKGFQIKGSTGKEFLWVEVQEIRNNSIVGTIGNDPRYDCGVVFGDKVEILREEISLVYDPGINKNLSEEDLLAIRAEE